MVNQNERLFGVEHYRAATPPSIKLQAIHAHSERIGRLNAEADERRKIETKARLSVKENQAQQIARIMIHFALSQESSPEE